MIGLCLSVFFLTVLPIENVQDNGCGTDTPDLCQNLYSYQDAVNKYRCNCAAGYTAGKDGCVCFNTSNVYNYTVLHDKGVQIQEGQTSLQFEVKTCHDAHVLLMTYCTNQDNDVYEIVIGSLAQCLKYSSSTIIETEIKASNTYVTLSKLLLVLAKKATGQSSKAGGWSNTRSVIRTAKQQDPPQVSFKHNDGPLICNRTKSFWIDWKDDVIKVGSGLDVGSNEYMRLNASDNFRIKYLAISTYINVPGYWMFNASQSRVCTKTSVSGNTPTGIDGTTTSNTQTPAQTTENTMTPWAENTMTEIDGTNKPYNQTPAHTTGNTTTSLTKNTATVTSSITTLHIKQSTPKMGTTETNRPNNSTCICPCHPGYNQTEKERETYLKKAIEQMEKELRMEKKNLSSAIRKKTSARDERVSAKTMGYTLGVCVLTTVFGSIIIGDLVNLGRFIWERFQ